MKVSEFFKDATGKFSMVRLMGFLCVIVGLTLALLTGLKVFYSQPIVMGQTVVPIDIGYIPAMTFLIIGIITIGMGIKTTQKWKEQETASENVTSPDIK